MHSKTAAPKRAPSGVASRATICDQFVGADGEHRLNNSNQFSSIEVKRSSQRYQIKSVESGTGRSHEFSIDAAGNLLSATSFSLPESDDKTVHGAGKIPAKLLDSLLYGNLAPWLAKSRQAESTHELLRIRTQFENDDPTCIQKYTSLIKRIRHLPPTAFSQEAALDSFGQPLTQQFMLYTKALLLARGLSYSRVSLADQDRPQDFFTVGAGDGRVRLNTIAKKLARLSYGLFLDPELLAKTKYAGAFHPSTGGRRGIVLAYDDLLDLAHKKRGVSDVLVHELSHLINEIKTHSVEIKSIPLFSGSQIGFGRSGDRKRCSFDEITAIARSVRSSARALRRDGTARKVYGKVIRLKKVSKIVVDCCKQSQNFLKRSNLNVSSRSRSQEVGVFVASFLSEKRAIVCLTIRPGVEVNLFLDGRAAEVAHSYCSAESARAKEKLQPELIDAISQRMALQQAAAERIMKGANSISEQALVVWMLSPLPKFLTNWLRNKLLKNASKFAADIQREDRQLPNPV